MEDATKKGQVQEFFYKKLQRRPGQPMAEWAKGLNVEIKSMGWHFFQKEKFDSRATGTCVGSS